MKNWIKKFFKSNGRLKSKNNHTQNIVDISLNGKVLLSITPQCTAGNIIVNDLAVIFNDMKFEVESLDVSNLKYEAELRGVEF